jgi:hypothetical protein
MVQKVLCNNATNLTTPEKQSLRQCFNEHLENALQSAFGRVQKTPLDDFTWVE